MSPGEDDVAGARTLDEGHMPLLAEEVVVGRPLLLDVGSVPTLLTGRAASGVQEVVPGGAAVEFDRHGDRGVDGDRVVGLGAEDGDRIDVGLAGWLRSSAPLIVTWTFRPPG